MPSDAEKATRAHEKKLKEGREELQRQARLAERRAVICNQANNVLPRFDKPDIPDTPLVRTYTNTSGYGFPTGKQIVEPFDERSFETPFKAAKRYNPLEEKKKSAEDEERRLIAEISKTQGVNLSQAKVLLAHNPSLRKSPLLRTTSDGSSSSGSSPNMNTTRPAIIRLRSDSFLDPNLADCPLSPIPSTTTAKAQKLMGIPSDPATEPRRLSKNDVNEAISSSRRQSTGLGFTHPRSYSMAEAPPAVVPEQETFGGTQPLNIRRQPLYRSMTSGTARTTMSIDTTMIPTRPAYFRANTSSSSIGSNASSLSKFGTSPSSPLNPAFQRSKQNGQSPNLSIAPSESHYSASIYSPYLGRNVETATIARGSDELTPRVMSFATFKADQQATRQQQNQAGLSPGRAPDVDMDDHMSESRLFEIAQRY